MAKTNTAISSIQSLRKRFYSALPGKEQLSKLISETEVADQVYNSNAIENSTLTYEETEKILMQIELDRNVTIREVFEAKNLARVVGYIQSKATAEELNSDIILLLHQMLISNIRDDIAGRFREEGEYVRVGNHIAADPKDIPELLRNALIQYQSSSDQNIVKRISQLHLEFENIHPFNDGNGRIGRVINNYLLIREGYVPIDIKFASRKQYYDAFAEYDVGRKTKIMEGILARSLTNSYHKRLAYLEAKKIITLVEYSRLNSRSHSGLINMANRQTIEAFLEKGVWKIAEDFKVR